MEGWRDRNAKQKRNKLALMAHKIVVVLMISLAAVLLPSVSDAHRSGCHRWQCLWW